MNDRNIKKIGENKIIGYQKLIIGISCFLLLIMLPVYFFDRTTSGLLIILFGIFFSALVLLNSSRFFDVKIDSEYFYIKNLFINRKIRTDEFETIRVVHIFPYTIKIIFKNGSSYKLKLSAKETVTAIIFSGKQELSRRLKIQLKPKLIVSVKR